MKTIKEILDYAIGPDIQKEWPEIKIAMQEYADQQSTSDKELIESLNTDLGIMNDNLLKSVEERNVLKRTLEEIYYKTSACKSGKLELINEINILTLNALTTHP